jgi:hypothetical protein
MFSFGERKQRHIIDELSARAEYLKQLYENTVNKYDKSVLWGSILELKYQLKRELQNEGVYIYKNI